MFEKIILTRLEYWAKKYGILSPMQYGFRKGRQTRDCVALLSTAIQTYFEYKQQTLVGFLDISGAYDNVLIDKSTIKCIRHSCQRELRVMWNLLWRKEMVFL
jgi:hypothetical protein